MRAGGPKGGALVLLGAALNLLLPSAQAATLDLPAVLARVDEAPAVRLAAAMVDQARGEAMDAMSVDAPQLRVGVNDIARPLTTPWTSVGVRIPVPNPLTMVETHLAGTSAVDAAKAELGAAQRTAAQTLTRLFVEAVGAREVALAWEEHAGRLATLTASTQQRREQGFSTALDLVRVRADLARAQAQAASARAEADAARGQLLLQVRWSGDAPELVAPPAPSLPASLEAALDRAVDGDPGLAALSAEVSRAEHAAKAARGRAIPWFDWIQPTVQLEPLETRVNLTTSVSLPVWSWGTGAAKAALAERAGAQAQAALRVEALHAEVTAAWFGWQGAHENAAALEAGLVAIDGDIATSDPSMHAAMRAEQGRLLVEVARARAAESAAAWTLAGALGR